eukprot:16628-Heterococcus_DN1.PRE.1
MGVICMICTLLLLHTAAAAVPGEAPVVSHAVAREEFLKLTVAYLKVQWGGPGTPLHELATAALEVCTKDSDPAVSRLSRESLHLLDTATNGADRIRRRSSSNKVRACF